MHPDSPKNNRNPSLQLTKRAGASSRSLPADAATTRINIASDGSTTSPVVDAPLEPAAPELQPTINEGSDGRDGDTVGGVSKDKPQGLTDTTTPDAAPETTEPSGTEETSSDQTGGWFSWLYSFTTAGSNPPGNIAPAEASSEQSTKDQPPKESGTEQINKDTEDQNKVTETTEISQTSQKRSWLQMWYGSSTPPKGGEGSRKGSPTPADEPTENNNQKRTTLELENNKPDEAVDAPKSTSGNTRPSGWSFWFRDGSKGDSQHQQGAPSPDASVTQEVPSKHLHHESESEPEPKVEVAQKGIAKIKPLKDSTKADMIAHGVEPNAAPLPPKTSEATASRQLQKALPNQVLPRFHDTFALEETPSWWQTIGRFLHYKKEPHYKHVYMIKEPPHIKRALAIGIHGYFPAPFIRTVLGQPTGTSVRFSNMAAEAIQKWTDAHGYQCDIEKLALEGEGRISERVDLLWKLLLNGMDEIRKADFIMVACHSQGVPVAIMLVAKLIAFGCMDAARVGICAMAGVNMGPFSDYRSRWISGSAGELFEFALPHSQVSKDYEASLKTVLQFGVRISYIGSIDDQLVSLEVSTPPANHLRPCTSNVSL